MLEKAVALAKSGDRAGARELLQRVVAVDPQNARAWGWVAACAATADERRAALERVLEIDPANVAAQCALGTLTEPDTKRASTEPTASDAGASSQPKRFRSWLKEKPRKVLIALSILLFTACVCPFAALGTLLKQEQPSAARAVGDVAPPTLTPSPVASATQWSTATRSSAAQPTATLTPTDKPRPTETPALSPTPVIAIIDAQVVQVVDGDTIRVLIRGVEHTVRYIGIEAPETKPPSEPQEWMGLESAAANEELVGGKIVRLEKDVSESDSQGRLLRYVYVGDTFINHELVRRGFAEAKAVEPDLHHAELLDAAQNQAKAAGIGVWAAPALVGLDCLESAYVADVTVPDNSRFGLGESFVKTWRVRNAGTCAWPPNTQLTVTEDDALLSPGSVHVGALRAGESTEISVEMTAPAAAGRYGETWRLSQGSNRFFGGNLTVVVDVQAVPSPQTGSATAPAATTPTAPPAADCDPAYPTVCIAPPPPDLNCKDIPFKLFQVLPPDPHQFDGNRNGIGCED